MTDRPVLTPTASHPITVEPTGGRVVVSVDGEVLADTDAALTLREASYPAVQYVPLADVVVSRLTRSEHSSYCPFKGEASYYHVVTDSGRTVPDAVWTYEQPFPAVAQIAGYLAFYPDRADVSVATRP